MISFVDSPNYVVVLVSLVNVLCWGTWGILGKLAEPIDTGVFSFGFVIGQVIVGLIYCFTLGMVGSDPSFMDTISDTPFTTGLGIALGGALVCWANAFVNRAAALVGVSVAFPMCMGSGLVGGSTLNYMIQPENSLAEWLFPGLAFALCGAVLGGVAERLSPYKPKVEVEDQSKPNVTPDVEDQGNKKDMPKLEVVGEGEVSPKLEGQQKAQP